MAGRKEAERVGRRRGLLLAPLALMAGLAVPYALSDDEPERLGDAARAGGKRFLSLPSGTTHYEEAGPEGGQPVVLVHGTSLPMLVWDDTFPALAAAGLRAIRYDLYGRGLSDRLDAAYDPDLYDAQLSGLLAALAPDRPVDLVGMSMGGIIVSEFARRHPERVRKVVLIDPAGVGVKVPAAARLTLLPGLGEYTMRIAGTAKLLPARRNLLHPERIPTLDRRYLATIRFQGSRRAVLQSLRHMPLETYADGYAALGAVGKPTLLVWGRGDALIPFENSARVRELVRATDFIAVEDAGHLPQLERPEVVTPALLAFLAR